MAARELDVEIRRRGRRQDRFVVHADPADIPGLRDILAGWLEGHRWDRGLWPQFEMHVRHAGEYRVQRKVRP